MTSLPDAAPELRVPDLDLNKLRTFFAIVEAGGVTAAAQRLSLTRSAVSHSLANLESSLGQPLFHRVGKKLVLTRDGRVLKEAYAEVDQRLTHALDEIQSSEREVRGWIRLGLFVGFSRFRLADVLEPFLLEHPQARVRIAYGTHSELLEGLADSRLDFVLTLRAGKRDTPAAIRSTRLFDQQLVLVNRDRFRATKAFESFRQLPIIDFFRSDPLIDRWVEHGFGRRKHIDRRQVRAWVGSNSDLALELACRGVGATVLPRLLVEPFRKRGDLVAIHGPRGPLRDDIWLNELAAPAPNRVLSAFREALFERLG